MGNHGMDRVIVSQAGQELVKGMDHGKDIRTRFSKVKFDLAQRPGVGFQRPVTIVEVFDERDTFDREASEEKRRRR